MSDVLLCSQIERNLITVTLLVKLGSPSNFPVSCLVTSQISYFSNEFRRLLDKFLKYSDILLILFDQIILGLDFM